VEVLQILLDKSAPVKDAFAHSERVVRLLLRRAEIDVNAESPKHRTVLICVSYHGNEHIARLLLQHGAVINICRLVRSQLFDYLGQRG
jgi:ankyrin repeat protein